MFLAHNTPLYIQRRLVRPPVKSVFTSPIVEVYESGVAVTDVFVGVAQSVNLANVQHEWTRVGRDVCKRHHLAGQGRLIGRKQGSAMET